MEEQSRDDAAIIAAGRSGNEAAFDILYEKYKPLVKSRAGSFYLIGGEQQDLIQEGMIGLFKAVRDYDSSRGASFGTFAGLCITRQILTAIQKSGRDKEIPLNTALSLSKGEEEETEAQDYLLKSLGAAMDGRYADPEEQLIREEELAELLAAIHEKLSAFEQEVFRHQIEGLTAREIAQILGKSEKSIDNALQRIKSKIRTCKS